VNIRTDDLRIREIRELTTPEEVAREYPCSPSVSAIVSGARQALHRILHGTDDRLAVVIGPCSIHDTGSAMEYAHRLQQQRERLQDTLEIVMRVYFEKPRTTVGWKGLINDPKLDGSFSINEGLRVARQLLIDVNELGVPVGCEFLDMITPQYIADLVEVCVNSLESLAKRRESISGVLKSIRIAIDSQYASFVGGFQDRFAVST